MAEVDDLYEDFNEHEGIELDAMFDVDLAEDGADPGPEATLDQPSAAASSSTQAQSKKKKVIRRPKSTFTLAVAQAEKDNLVKTVLNEIANDQFACSTVLQHAPPLKAFTDNCCHLLQAPPPEFNNQLDSVLQILWPALSASDNHIQETSRRQAMYSKFHLIRQGDEFKNAVSRLFFILSHAAELPRCFMQMFSRRLFEMLLLRHEEIPSKIDRDNTGCRLTSDEENALRYASGYVVHALPRKIMSKGITNVSEVIDRFTSGHDKETRLSYTREWIGLQNRGGLVEVNDSTFLLFCELEIIVRRRCPQTAAEARNLDLRAGAAEAAVSCRKVIRLWEDIIKDNLPESKSLQLLQLIMDFYVQIRGFSFARNIVEKFKIRTKEARKRKGGLRKGLKRSNNPAST